MKIADFARASLASLHGDLDSPTFTWKGKEVPCVPQTIGTNFVVAGLGNIPDPAERARIAARLSETGRDVIEINRHQVTEFAGNGLELTGSRGRIFALSSRALAALRPDQIAAIETSARILAINIPTIERSGGSVRCMLAGIHLPPRQPGDPAAPAA